MSHSCSPWLRRGVSALLAPALLAATTALPTHALPSTQVAAASGADTANATFAEIEQPGMPAPTGFTATVTGNDVLLTWDAGATEGQYRVLYWYLSANDFSFADQLGAATTSHLLEDLEPGEHTYHLSAIGSGVEGPGTSVTFTVAEPTAPVGAPADLSLTSTPVVTGGVMGSSATTLSATLRWNAPSEGAGLVTGYEVTGPAGTVTLAASARSHTVTGLDITRAHELFVTTRTASGTGAWASVTTEAARVPSAPTEAAVSVGFGATMSWKAPNHDGGAPVLRYEVSRPHAGPVSVTAPTTTASLWSMFGAESSYYKQGTAYTFTVVAVNAVGRSEPATVRWANKHLIPATPSVSVLANGTQLSVHWNSPTDEFRPEITGYEVNVPSLGTFQVPATQTSLSLDGVYGKGTVSVAAKTNGYTGTLLSERGVMQFVGGHRAPGAPEHLKATLKRTDATITWSGPTEPHGHDSLTWTVDWGTGRTTVADDKRSVVITDIPRSSGRTVKVWAVGNRSTAAGPARTITAKPSNEAPTAPRSFAATMKDSTATLTWKAPADTGGKAVTGYRLVYKGKVIQKPKAGATKATVKGFGKGETRKFSLYAVNSIGQGTTATESVTRYTKPNAPTDAAVRLGWGTSINMAWHAPKMTGGKPVTSYKVEYQPVDRGGYKYGSTRSTTARTTTTGDITVPKGYWKARVQACTSIGCSDWSKWSSVKRRN